MRAEWHVQMGAGDAIKDLHAVAAGPHLGMPVTVHLQVGTDRVLDPECETGLLRDVGVGPDADAEDDDVGWDLASAADSDRADVAIVVGLDPSTSGPDSSSRCRASMA